MPPTSVGAQNDVGVALQLPVAAPEHVAGEDDARVALRWTLPDVLAGVRRAADDDELHPAGALGGDARERLDEHVRVVLGLQAPDEQHVLARLEAEALERLGPLVAGVLDAVRARRRSAGRSGCSKMSATTWRVGQRLVGPARRVALGEAQVAPSPAPGHFERSESRPSTLMTVGMPAARVIRHSGLLPAMKNSATSGRSRARGVQRAEQRVRERVEVLVADRRQVDEPRAAVLPERAVDDVRAAVDGDLVAARAEAAGELLGGRLEAAVGGGDPARAEDRDLHELEGEPIRRDVGLRRVAPS